MPEPKKNNNSNGFIKIVRFILFVAIFFGLGYWVGRNNYSINTLRGFLFSRKTKNQDKSIFQNDSKKDRKENEDFTFYHRLLGKEEVLLPATKVSGPKKTVGEKSQKIEKFTLQIASFQKEILAKEYINRLNDTAGFSPYIKPVNLSKQGIWYRVLVGEFKSESEAIEYGNRVLKPRGIYFLALEK